MIAMPAVDIVIPAFGRKAQLAEAVASVQAQTFTDWSLTIVDDASPEPVEAAAYVSDTRIRVLRLQQNSGPAFARNFGAAQGKAPFIAFLDSDDLWHPVKLQRQLDRFSSANELQWLHSNEIWLRSGERVKQKAIHRKQAGKFFERALERCLISPSAVMLRRSFFTANRGFAPAFRLCEDYELWLRLLLKAPVGFIEEALTIKLAGDWPQLSSTKEIDRYRILAMHRVLRLNGGEMDATDRNLLFNEAEKKCYQLVRGAEKHGNTARQRRYQAWLTLFKTLRTRPMRMSSCADSR